jgi:N6-L-threonylcarbamoyladenine synthase
MLVLGLETSCDETAVGIVDEKRKIRANIVATQFEAHRPYGGVVPEIAARAHLDKIDDCVRAALKEADTNLDSIDAIAATCGPGLIGGVMVGAMTAKAIAAAKNKPFIAVNHLEAHALTARLTHDVAFPYLLLLVSGGHCQILLAKGVGDFQKLGGTIDDAVGECFDKSAKLLGLGYPGGPLIERAAQGGNENAFKLPKPLVGREGCDFSFSGLKTALRQIVEDSENLAAPDLAASLQKTIAEILADRVANALKMIDTKPTALVVGGGVASNQKIRANLAALAAKNNLPFVAPPPALCTDNGVMIAWAGLEHFRLGQTDPLTFRARPRWPL